MKKYELLAPVGSMEAFNAAISAQADAIYLGGMKFGARSYADNFTEEELIEIIKKAHFYDVKVYVTVNTIIFENEFNEALNFIQFLYENGVDAVIVQDLGLLKVISKKYPNLDIHASTQMNIHTLEEVQILKTLGVKRVVLARETSIDEIKRIKENIDIELEVFVHGAICISHSGNCYMSSFICKRSGNRGKCAGSCRLEYSLDNGYRYKYFLSAKDLMTIDDIGKLIDLNVDSFKIEGRMKRKEYVLQVVSSYKKAIEAYINQEMIDLNEEKKRLKLIFNREFSKGFLFKDENKNIVNNIFSNHIGIVAGKVVESYNTRSIIKLCEDINYGDGLRFVGRKTDAIVVNEVKVNGDYKKSAHSGEFVEVKTHERDMNRSVVYKTTDALQLNELNNLKHPEVKIKGKVYIEQQNIVFEITDGNHIVRNEVSYLEKANSNYNERIYEQLMKCGPLFKMENLQKNLDYQVFIQISKVNELRRKCLEDLKTLREKKNKEIIINSFEFDKINVHRNDLHLSCRVRTLEQLNSALDNNISYIYICDYKLYKKYENDHRVFYYPPRVANNVKENKMVVSTIDKVNGNFISVYANVNNSYTVATLQSLGARQIGLSIELSLDKMSLLIDEYLQRNNDLPNLEVMVYGNVELMVNKYCVINDYTKHDKLFCNECVKKQYYLTDRNNYSFPLVREENCNLKVLNSKKLHLLDYINKIASLGVNSLLLDFQLENYDETSNVIKMYKNKINGIDDNKDLKEIKDVTYGHLLEGVL